MFISKKLLCLMLLCSLSSGCSVIAPERNSANKLMGKNITEAYKIFGQPLMISKETSVKPSDSLYGQKIYLFVRDGITYNRQKVLGGDTEAIGGQLVHTTYVQNESVQENCRVAFWTKDNIIDYYEIQGNCGLFDWGFGNTGSLHRLGIN